MPNGAYLTEGHTLYKHEEVLCKEVIVQDTPFMCANN